MLPLLFVQVFSFCHYAQHNLKFKFFFVLFRVPDRRQGVVWNDPEWRIPDRLWDFQSVHGWYLEHLHPYAGLCFLISNRETRHEVGVGGLEKEPPGPLSPSAPLKHITEKHCIAAETTCWEMWWRNVIEGEPVEKENWLWFISTVQLCWCSSQREWCVGRAKRKPNYKLKMLATSHKVWPILSPQQKVELKMDGKCLYKTDT